MAPPRRLIIYLFAVIWLAFPCFSVSLGRYSLHDIPCCGLGLEWLSSPLCRHERKGEKNSGEFTLGLGALTPCGPRTVFCGALIVPAQVFSSSQATAGGSVYDSTLDDRRNRQTDSSTVTQRRKRNRPWPAVARHPHPPMSGELGWGTLHPTEFAPPPFFDRIMHAGGAFGPAPCGAALPRLNSLAIGKKKKRIGPTGGPYDHRTAILPCSKGGPASGFHLRAWGTSPRIRVGRARPCACCAQAGRTGTAARLVQFLVARTRQETCSKKNRSGADGL